MTLEQIKAAVLAGETVHYQNGGYVVTYDHGRFYILCTFNGSMIGLTWQDGVTMNGDEREFYLGQEDNGAPAHGVCDVIRTLQRNVEYLANRMKVQGYAEDPEVAADVADLQRLLKKMSLPLYLPRKKGARHEPV